MNGRHSLRRSRAEWARADGEDAMRSRLFSGAFFAAAGVAVALAGSAQAAERVSGRVRDAAGEPVVGAMVTIQRGDPAHRVTVFSAITGNITAPTLSMELAHPVIIGVVDGGSPASTIWSNMLHLDYDPSVKPFVVGPAAIVMYAGGSVATDLFASLVWAEFTKTELGL